MSLPAIIGNSPAIKRSIAMMDRFAKTSLPILLVGATGTGKDLFARHIHANSKRSGNLVDVNCGALPAGMIESLLFGHRRGSFTGAVESVTGHVEQAHGGTLFLDELLQLPVSAQVALLRVLESGEVQPLGDNRKKQVDLRIVAAGQDDTAAQLEKGQFRRDLFQRLAGAIIPLPTLTNRPEDIVPLATVFANQQRQRLQRGADRVLHGYSWPGNVRELRLTIQRAGCLVENGTLPASAISDAIKMGAVATVSHHEGHELVELLRANKCNVSIAAACLGLRKSAFYMRLRRAGISIRATRAMLEVGINTV